jgi:hydrogenase expression/formation protein HypE
MHELIRTYFSPAFGIEGSGDSAVVNVTSKRLAYTTDSYVVTPLFFPGGNIGELAVNGTVNDLAVAGAEPLYLTVGFVVEEGFLISELKTIVTSMAAAAGKAGVKIVAGDTKVVNKGKADGIFINTSGISAPFPMAGIFTWDQSWAIKSSSAARSAATACPFLPAQRPDVRSAGLSDTRALNGLVHAMYEVSKEIRFMRDPTRADWQRR